MVISLCVRGFGRSQSRSYAKMVKALEQSKSAKASNASEEAKKAMRLFDIDFKHWEVDFDARNVKG